MKKVVLLLSALAIAVASPVLSTAETLETDVQSDPALHRDEVGDLNREAIEAGDYSGSKLATAETMETDLESDSALHRDEIGDLNREAVEAGDFPGSIRIPGPGKVSLRIGGFMKMAAIADSDAEAMGIDFTPHTLGTKRTDDDGGFSLDASATRIHMDARAPAPNGSLRAYVEWDFNSGNDGSPAVRVRHAYGAWTTSYGTLTAGHTWSTMMDTKSMPESLGVTSMSGTINVRQALLRWSQPLAPQVTLHAAIEDPSSSDIFSETPVPGKTSLPDVVMGLEYNQGVRHMRLNGILRKIEVEMPAGGNDDEMGWGLALFGTLDLLEDDNLGFGGVYGKGLGQYLHNIQSIDGGAVNAVRNELQLRDNRGIFANYQHHWAEDYRSTAMIGYSFSDPLDWQDEDTLESTTYGAVNLLWQALPYLTMGVEYGYGRRENMDGSSLDNHRLMFGLQVY